MKRFTFRTFALVFALIAALTAAAYALSGGWGVGDYIANRYNRDIPEDFSSEYAQNLSQTVGGVTFSVRDAYVEGDTLYAIVTLKQADGGNAVFLMGDLTESDTIDNLFLDEHEDGRTIAQYAADNKLPVQQANFWFTQGDEYIESGLDTWLEEDGTFACAMIATDVAAKNDEVKLLFNVSAVDQNGDPQRASLDMTLPVLVQKDTVIEVNADIEGLPVRVDKLYLHEGRLGYRAEIAFTVLDTGTDEERAFVRDAIWFELIDPATGERLPEGGSVNGAIEQLSESSFLQKGDSISASWQGKTIILRAYDCWEKTRYGSVEVTVE